MKARALQVRDRVELLLYDFEDAHVRLPPGGGITLVQPQRRVTLPLPLPLPLPLRGTWARLTMVMAWVALVLSLLYRMRDPGAATDTYAHPRAVEECVVLEADYLSTPGQEPKPDEARGWTSSGALADLHAGLRCLEHALSNAHAVWPAWLAIRPPGAPGHELIAVCHHHLRERTSLLSPEGPVCVVAERVGNRLVPQMQMVLPQRPSSDLLSLQEYQGQAVVQQHSLVLGTRYPKRHVRFPVSLLSPSGSRSIQSLEGEYALFVQLAMEEYVFIKK